MTKFRSCEPDGRDLDRPRDFVAFYGALANSFARPLPPVGDDRVQIVSGEC